MDYRRYGSTDMMVSRIGFGGMRFEEIDNQDACAAMVKKAYDHGDQLLRHRAGLLRRENRRSALGWRSSDMATRAKRNPFYVSTKSNKAEPSEEVRERPRGLPRTHGTGLVSTCSTCGGWSARNGTMTARPGAPLDEFTGSRRRDSPSHIALSSHMAGNEIAEVLADYDFDGVLLGYSAMNFAFRDAALDAAAASNRGVVVHESPGRRHHPHALGSL